eukprot:m51a1_g6222 hypothetical protein (226) ;mRNA; r:225553-226521
MEGEDCVGAASRLGTKEHWDQVYARERQNFSDNPEDVGEIWFGETVLKRVISAMLKLPGVTKASRVLDVGCGNGYSVIELAKRGFTELYGSDYSASAVELARSVAASEGLQEPAVTFFVDDLTRTSDSRTYDVVFDKGTFDAVSLAPQETRDAVRDAYKRTVHKLLGPGEGRYFVITSCNYTRQELVDQFAAYFDVHSYVDFPVIRFGGASGSTNAAAVFVHKKQ